MSDGVSHDWVCLNCWHFIEGIIHHLQMATHDLEFVSYHCSAGVLLYQKFDFICCYHIDLFINIYISDTSVKILR